jgi:hypothetical protein
MKKALPQLSGKAFFVIVFSETEGIHCGFGNTLAAALNSLAFAT